MRDPFLLRFNLPAGSERNSSDNLSFSPNHDSKSVSTPRRRNRLPVFINVPFLDGVSEKDIARNITIDETNPERLNSKVSCVPMVRCFRSLTYDVTWSSVIPSPPF